jgi:WhiB family redox-sensing transcriptional regulator
MNPDTLEAEGKTVETAPVDSAEPESTEPRLTRNAEEWRARAVCAQTDPEVFFPEHGSSTAAAKKICASCHVRSECLTYALENGENFGVWGGLSSQERKALRPGAVPGPGTAARQQRDREVLELRKYGRKASSIARTTGVNERTVHRIITRADAAQKGA